jgi:hypothetical protein
VKDAAEATAKRLVKAPITEANLMLLVARNSNVGNGGVWVDKMTTRPRRDAVHFMDFHVHQARVGYFQSIEDRKNFLVLG